jgi:protein-disulfide isomerase
MADKKEHAEHEKHVTHEKHTTAQTAPKSQFWEPATIALVLVIVVLLVYIGYTSMSWQPTPNVNNTNITNGTVENNTAPKQAGTTLELFVMSHCPYGVQQEGVVQDIISKFNGQVNLSLHFIASDNGDGTFSSLHGPSEVAEDLRQVCIMKYYPDDFLSYLSCIDQNYDSSDQIWSGCASQSDMDTNVITQCSNGSEGASLLKADTQLTNQMQVQSSPTIYVGGQQYVGVQSESQLTTDICTLIPGSDACSNTTQVSVGLTIVNDKNCVVCDPSQIVGTLESNFGMNNMSITSVDYSSDTGKALMQQFNLTGVPAYIFNASIASHPSYGSLSQYLHQVGSSYLLLVQPIELVNAVASNNTLELFVMSWCPYGTATEVAVNTLLHAMPEITVSGPHFIATSTGNGTFTSLHGPGEVAEDLRQVCIMKYYNTSTLFNYLMCIDANVSSSADIWQQCASGSGIDIAKIGNCSTGTEGTTLLNDNIGLANSMGIQSSPTLIFNNNTMISSAESADQIRQIFCGYNPALAGCNSTLNGTTSTPSGGCG